MEKKTFSLGLLPMNPRVTKSKQASTTKKRKPNASHQKLNQCDGGKNGMNIPDWLSDEGNGGQQINVQYDVEAQSNTKHLMVSCSYGFVLLVHLTWVPHLAA